MSRARSLTAATVAAVLAACSGGDGDAGDLFSLDADQDPRTGTTPPDDITPPDDDTTPAGDTTTTVATVADVARPDVDPITCGSLLDIFEVDIPLGLLDLPMSERSSFEYSRGETCRWVWAEDDSRAATIEPGLPSDTDPGTVLIDVEGSPVSGIGDAAAWFVDGDRGLLAVGADTELGRLSFRIILDRPDVGPDERRDVAVEVAHIVLPRFPGVERPPPPEVDLTGMQPTLDRSQESLVELWRDGVESGRWDEGEGLVALLGAVAGVEPTPDEVDELDGFGRSATGLVAAARAFVTGGDPTARTAEIERLLDEIVPSRDRLQRAVLSPPSATVPTTTSGGANGFRRTVDQPCPDPVIGDTCLVKLNIPDLDETYGEDEYIVFVGGVNGSESFVGWSDDQVGDMIEAIRVGANWLEPRGEMPTVTVFLAPDGDSPTSADARPELCTIVVTPAVRAYPGEQQQQFVAGQLAHCFLAATYTDLYAGAYPADAWWSAGAAIWLSNEIRPDANLEWVHLPDQLTGHELQTSIVQRGQTNGIWFQHLRWQYTVEGLLDVLAATPTDPGVDALAGWPEMQSTFHDFVQSLSDLGVPDSGTDQRAGDYDVPADLVEVDAPLSAHVQLDAFRTNRLELQVLNGDVACIDAAPSGGATMTWRTGPRRSTGNWSSVLPDSIQGTALFAGSSLADGGAIRVTVTDVVDHPDDCDSDDADDDDGAPGCDLDCGPSEYYTEPEG